MQPPTNTVRAEDVIAFAEAHWGRPCRRCAAPLIGHEAVLSLLLGLRDDAQCFGCLSAAHGQERGPFLTKAAQNVSRLACYRAGWVHSDARLAAAGPWPEDRLPSALRLPEEDDDADDDLDGDDAASFDAASDRFDAGDQGCGELVLALRARLAALPPGATLHLTATDLGAPEDLPAWCRLTGHRLVRAEHPEYLIARRPD